MPRNQMFWNSKAIQGVPEEIVRDMTRFIENGRIHDCTWFVRYMLQGNFVKVALNGTDEDRKLIGAVYRAMLQDAPQGCFGSEEATLQWPGLRNIK